MLLYAETILIFSFNYSFFNKIVIILTRWNISAGTIFKNEYGTSETLCNRIVDIKNNMKFISVHVPNHLKPLNENQFGYYLAGLIDGDGHFSTKQQLVIAFHYLDISLAYYIKEKLGYGSVTKIKDKNAFILVLAAKKGLEKVITLINGKLRTEVKMEQINKNILNHSSFLEFSKNTKFQLDTSIDLENHWLAGFSDADASFQIKLLKRINRLEVRVNFQIDQKRDTLLLLIKDYLGGNIGYRQSQDTYYYGSTSFGSAKRVITYFDKFHLLSSKYINYLKWRKAYLIIKNRGHLTDEGVKKIRKLKDSMNLGNKQSTTI